jgi:hypothetical protein
MSDQDEYQFNHNISLVKDKIGMFIGSKGLNITNNIYEPVKKEYCSAMNLGNPDSIIMDIQVRDKDGYGIAYWNNFKEVEMRIINPIIKKYIDMEVTRISKFESKPKLSLIKNESNVVKNIRQYIVKINVGKHSIKKIIGAHGHNTEYLKQIMRENIGKCGTIHIVVSNNNNSKKFYHYKEPFDGGGTDAWLIVDIVTKEMVFTNVITSIKKFMEELFGDDDSEVDEVDEYEMYDRSDW